MTSNNDETNIAPQEHARLVELCNRMNSDVERVMKEVYVDDNGSIIELVISQGYDHRLPANFASFFPKLQVLEISSCPSMRNIAPIAGCRMLEVLELNNCRRLEKIIPAEFANLNELGELHLTRLFVRALPPQIGNLRKLRTLAVTHCRNLKTLPQEIGLLDKLEKLEVRECDEFETVPAVIGEMKTIESIVLVNCYSLNHVPLEMWKLPNLEMVDITASALFVGLEEIPTLDEFSLSLRNIIVYIATRKGVKPRRKLCEPLKKILYFAELNRAGRKLLHQKKQPSAKLWSHALVRSSSSLNALYFFLKEKPELVAMSDQELERL